MAVNRKLDTFAQDAGIDVSDARPSVWDEFHEIQVARLRDDNLYLRKRTALYGMWKLAALVGWGMFGIACLSHIKLP